jgi:RNA-directed DNA polymerase
MTAVAGAPSTRRTLWKAIIWSTVEYEVRRLQLRIAKAIKLGRLDKAKALQWLLTHSFYGKLLAVRRVTQNSGKRTPGVDEVVWKTDKQKIDAAYAMKRKGYQAKPLRRIYIPKKNGKLRALGIPTKSDRAQQALHLLGLLPISEVLADENSYGFRPKRSTHDAIAQCFTLLSRGFSPQWVLEGDIKACFDKISHEWLEKHVIMDKVILKQWLKAGYIEKDIFNSTEEGTPQGGVASPTLANIALVGSNNWCFFCKAKTQKGLKLYTLTKASYTRIKRHIKIRGKATPFDSDFDRYFTDRENNLKRERNNSRIVNSSLIGA